jgi:hypothetical protein
MHMHDLSTAQQVRLWFIAGVEALSFIFIIIMTTAFNYYPDLGITESNGDTLGIIGWLLVSQVAVITLGIILVRITMAHFAYVHHKLMRMIVQDDQGNKELDVPLRETINLRSESVQTLKDNGFLMAGRWNDVSDYSYAEVKKDKGR